MSNPLKKLENNVAIITGGAVGIGAATVRLFADHGAKVVIIDINSVMGCAFQQELEKLGHDVLFIQCDVSSEQQIIAAVQKTLSTYGRIDILFNNAGIALPGLTHETKLDSWRRVMNINLDAAFLLSREVITEMMKSGGGAIVNTSSIMGHVACVGASSYNTSKHALIGLTKSLALEYAVHGIRVNAVCPGYVMTDMGRADLAADSSLGSLHALNRFAEPEEIAKAVLFLASDDSSFVTGSSLMIDGGYVAR
ncbi:Cyclopentanol dehydrogenase [compost metagenome]